MRVMFSLTILLSGLVLVTGSPPTPDRQASNGAVAQFHAVANSQTFPCYDRVLLLETTSDTSANVSVGDLNGDGNLDILLVKGRHWPLMSRVLLGDGRGHFPIAYNLGERPYRSYAGRLVDIDGDGDLDVVLSNDTPDAKVIYLNDGKGHFHLGSSYGRAEWETRNASVADLNGDGQPDIIVANRTDKNPANYICLNKGKGSFDADCIPFSHESATTITQTDFNRDGLIDLVVPHRDGGQSYVYLAGAKAVYSNLRRIPFGPADAEIRMAEVVDFDRDGLPDIVAIDEKRGVSIYFDRKDGTFLSGVALSSGKVSPYALAVSDLNGDGRMDIVVGNVEAPSTIYFNGSGRRFTPIQFGDNKGAVYGFAIADLDRDGLPDIIVARSDAPNAVYFASAGPSKIPQEKRNNGKQGSGVSHLIGNWSGESICVNKDKFPACHDEQVVYRIIKSSGKSNMLIVTMDKIVSGKPETMGVFDFVYEAQKQTLSSEFTRNNWHGIWEFALKGDLMDGTLATLPDKTTVRRIKVKKDK